MSQPRPESRLSEIESKMAIQDARIRELHDDNAEEFRALRQTMEANFTSVKQEIKQEIKRVEDDMKSSFLDIGKAFDLNANNIEAVKQDVGRLESRLESVETRLGAVETDVKSIKTTQDEHGTMLREILDRLPPKQG